MTDDKIEILNPSFHKIKKPFESPCIRYTPPSKVIINISDEDVFESIDSSLKPCFINVFQYSNVLQKSSLYQSIRKHDTQNNSVLYSPNVFLFKNDKSKQISVVTSKNNSYTDKKSSVILQAEQIQSACLCAIKYNHKYIVFIVDTINHSHLLKRELEKFEYYLQHVSIYVDVQDKNKSEEIVKFFMNTFISKSVSP